ncbi:Metallo-peptidase family M12-domain-containing protein [Radiomyces spectabilis]|uniref:Metallo-peptidase family M12-domain-containing protein n=1 Tax=Radiomyces spectabilis TaxID=64574 RepID=UPI0022203A3F|nr:Metallo-peptidase family M12-domain-containing protein [Radiomyces spectabilis]KAI8373155.1 Metallo-peptidase family M12-domain-containing protein [Radiomyces spectabilis]
MLRFLVQLLNVIHLGYVLTILAPAFAHPFTEAVASTAEPVSLLDWAIVRPHTVPHEKRVPSWESTRDEPIAAIQHDDHLQFTIHSFNQTVVLHLYPNLDLFHPDAVTATEDTTEPLRHSDFRIYRGYVTNRQDETTPILTTAPLDKFPSVFNSEYQNSILGWSRIVVRDDLTHRDKLSYPIFEGTFSVHNEVFEVIAVDDGKIVQRSKKLEPRSDTEIRMMIYRHSTPFLTPRSEPFYPTCGIDGLQYNQDILNSFAPPAISNSQYGSPSLDADRVKNNVDLSNLRSTNAASGCPSTRKVLYMGAAADCTYTAAYKSPENVRRQIINNWNSVSGLYERTFNIQIALVNITVMSQSCPEDPLAGPLWNRACSPNYSIKDRLSDFSLWRSYVTERDAGLWHLMTNCPMGLDIGIAWLKQLCNADAVAQTEDDGVMRYVSGTGVSSAGIAEWKTVAHEIGHGFGAVHDCTSDYCPCSGSSCGCCPLSQTICDADGMYMMNPKNNVTSSNFSPCSQQSICRNIAEQGSCLKDVDDAHQKIQSLGSCGNGIKEDGEDCDAAGRDTPCCDPLTCKFRENAVCEDINDACCSACRLQPSSYECRPAIGPCDVAEYCTGNSSACPTDRYVENLTECGPGLQCASGYCTSRHEQCKARGFYIDPAPACPATDDECHLTCANAAGSGCMVFNDFLIDGSPCGKNKQCQSGQCKVSHAGSATSHITVSLAVFLGMFTVWIAL